MFVVEFATLHFGSPANEQPIGKFIHKIHIFEDINSNAVSGSNMYRAYGDWTSWRWVNKYARSRGGVQSLVGETTFNILPSGGKYKVETSWVLDCWLYTFTHRHIGFGLYCLFYYLYKT